LTPEGKVKKKLRAYLDPLKPEVWYHMPVPTGYSDKGTPDFIICFYGTFLAIETKAGKNTPTPLQDRALKAIQAASGISMVINDKNIEGLIACLEILAIEAKNSRKLVSTSVPPYG
jgi:hypothetical protein